MTMGNILRIRLSRTDLSVIIVIFAILSGIAFPALIQGRPTANAINRVANLNQISCSLAIYAYAEDDSYAVEEGHTLTVPAPGVLGNDFSSAGDPLTPTLVSGPSNGTLTLNANGSFTYT